MFSLYKFSAVAALAISVPATAQTVAVPPAGSQDGMSNMPTNYRHNPGPG